MSEILTIAEAGKRIAAKQLSPVELVREQLARIGKLDPKINAFLLVTEERALADARAAEARQMAGTLRGPLAFSAGGRSSSRRPHGLDASPWFE